VEKGDYENIRNLETESPRRERGDRTQRRGLQEEQRERERERRWASLRWGHRKILSVPPRSDGGSIFEVDLRGNEPAMPQNVKSAIKMHCVKSEEGPGMG